MPAREEVISDAARDSTRAVANDAERGTGTGADEPGEGTAAALAVVQPEEREPDGRAPAGRREALDLVARAAQLEAELEELRATTWWRVGGPVRAAVTLVRLRLLPLFGVPSPYGTRSPSPQAPGNGRAGGTFVRLAKLTVPLRVRRFVRERYPEGSERLLAVSGVEPARPPSVDELVSERFPLLRPLSVFPVPTGRGLRLTLVTDSLGTKSLFGGVGTSIILAALLARRLDASLRIVTRSDPPDPARLATVLRAHEIPWDGNVEFVHSSLAPSAAGVPVRAEDLFLTTSWWNTWAALRSVDPARIVYLLQEDERMFYPVGDEQLMCSEVLADERVRFVVNTAMLHEYLVGEGFENIGRNGIAFEPAFPESIYYHEPRPEGAPKTFFFYARPHNVRNLFVRGLEALRRSLIDEVLRPDDWTFHFVGKDVPAVALPYGVEPQVAENLPWPEYAAFVRRVDVGLSLMSSPHPSYPPLDIAACGAVAVTNRFGPKQSLDRYSANIICTDPSVDALVEGIARAVALDEDAPRRERNRAADGLSRSWEDSFRHAIDELVRIL